MEENGLAHLWSLQVLQLFLTFSLQIWHLDNWKRVGMKPLHKLVMMEILVMILHHHNTKYFL